MGEDYNVIFMCEIINFVIFTAVISRQEMSYLVTKHKINNCCCVHLKQDPILSYEHNYDVAMVVFVGPVYIKILQMWDFVWLLFLDNISKTFYVKDCLYLYFMRTTPGTPYSYKSIQLLL